MPSAGQRAFKGIESFKTKSRAPRTPGLSRSSFMARLVLRDSIPSKILLIAVFAFASLCIETSVAKAQHPTTGARMPPPARAVVPPAPHTTVSQPRVVTSPRLTVLGARFGLRPGPNNLFRRRLFFRAPFFRFGPAFAFHGFWWQNCGPYWVWG